MTRYVKVGYLWSYIVAQKAKSPHTYCFITDIGTLIVSLIIYFTTSGYAVDKPIMDNTM